ncbi:MAG: hypothetical protein Fur003_5940 [Candidatus Dojkabacteria bacterium]
MKKSNKIAIAYLSKVTNFSIYLIGVIITLILVLGGISIYLNFTHAGELLKITSGWANTLSSLAGWMILILVASIFGLLLLNGLYNWLKKRLETVEDKAKRNSQIPIKEILFEIHTKRERPLPNSVAGIIGGLFILAFILIFILSFATSNQEFPFFWKLFITVFSTIWVIIGLVSVVSSFSDLKEKEISYYATKESLYIKRNDSLNIYNWSNCLADIELKPTKELNTATIKLKFFENDFLENIYLVELPNYDLIYNQILTILEGDFTSKPRGEVTTETPQLLKKLTENQTISGFLKVKRYYNQIAAIVIIIFGLLWELFDLLLINSFVLEALNNIKPDYIIVTIFIFLHLAAGILMINLGYHMLSDDGWLAVTDKGVIFKRGQYIRTIGYKLLSKYRGKSVKTNGHILTLTGSAAKPSRFIRPDIITFYGAVDSKKIGEAISTAIDKARQ